MIKLGVKLDDTQRSEVEKLITIADENNTKKLEFYEFKQFMYAVLNSPLRRPSPSSSTFTTKTNLELFSRQNSSGSSRKRVQRPPSNR
ncbi:EF-hand_domain pair [Hexamita inflata]|uniref:EF-hand domain pair n=1 Tax=Hexamita inflata TaxID=28002 RepID=A0AA86RF52_9EUKA|nr:EF-hand domain pair [Hexamita inflata]